MITKLTNGLLAGLLVLVLWHADTQAQQEVWERHIGAFGAAYQQGDYDEAATQIKAALEAAKAFGPDDPRLATTLNNLALLYEDQGRYAEAEPLYKRALAIWETALGPEHPHVATGRENYAAFLRETGRTEEADNLEDPTKAIQGVPQAYAQGGEGLNQFVGTWENIDRNTKGITRIEIQFDGTSPSVHVLGKCYPTDCDWGSTRAEVYGSNVVADLQQNASALRAIYDPGFAEKTLTMWLSRSGKLQVEAFTRFKDKSGRSNLASTYTFVRRQP